jgi:hypothetical protein
MSTGSAPLSTTVENKTVVSKIVASGTASLTPRNSNITLTSTNIGYMFKVVVDGILLSSETLAGNFTLKACFSMNKMDINSSGIFYNDGTNKVIYSYYYTFFLGTLNIFFNLRATDGSYTFNPDDYFGQSIYWEISNLTNSIRPGGGGGGAGDGKYYYQDLIIYDPLGNITTPLASTLTEFVNGTWSYFPNPLKTY